jgi:molybdopterin converting factor small subunit
LPVPRSKAGREYAGATQEMLVPESSPSLWHHVCMPKIHIPTPLRQYAGKQAAVDVKASSIADALSALVRQHPDLRRHLYTDDGKLRAFVNVYLNDEDVRYLQKDATAVKEGDTISIVPSIAGGRA